MTSAVVVLGLVVALAASASARAVWPPFLPPADTFSAAIARAVEHVWSDPTLDRSVEAPPASVPAALYVAFFDAPDVTAAAARHLAIAKYEVRVRDDGSYEADDHEGSRGIYRVLVREGGRRVIFSSGSHTGPILGTVTGSAVTVMDVEDLGGRTAQRLIAYVVIDNRVAAALASALQFAFGHLADRKLIEGFTVTARVVQWAIQRPDEFCPWLDDAPVPAARRESLLDALPHCRTASASVRTPRP